MLALKQPSDLYRIYLSFLHGLVSCLDQDVDPLLPGRLQWI
jgi:hypothetical protein